MSCYCCGCQVHDQTRTANELVFLLENIFMAKSSFPKKREWDLEESDKFIFV